VRFGSTTCVPVQRRECALPVSEHSALWAGIFKASGSTDPMWFLEERGAGASALRSSSRCAYQVIPRHGCWALIPANLQNRVAF
jgi:hypothetical protein